jgi:hypothetical protein
MAIYLSNRKVPSEVEYAKSIAADFSKKLPPSQNALEALSHFIYPVLDYLDSVTIDTTKSKVVGSLVQSFYWRDLVKNSLPASSDGLVVVFDNDCDIAPFTYRIE